jgi:hypothetical protein
MDMDRPMNVDRSIDGPVNRPVDRAINRPVDRAIDGSVNRAIDGPMNWAMRWAMRAAAAANLSLQHQAVTHVRGGVRPAENLDRLGLRQSKSG